METGRRKLLNLLKDGVSVFKVDSAGSLLSVGSISSYTNTASYIGDSGSTFYFSPSDVRFSSGTSVGFSASLAYLSAPDSRFSRSSAGVIQFGTTANNALGSWLATNGTLSGTLAVTGATTLTGNVGIGTTAPAATLDVHGGHLFVSSLGGVLGIGTTATTATLNVVASGISRIQQFSRASVAGVWGYEIGANIFGLYSDTDSKWYWRGTNGNLFLMETSGNVGIGTTTPDRSLTVVGSNGAGGIHLLDAAGTEFSIVPFGTNQQKLSIYDPKASLHRLVIDSSGNVGIGTTAPDHKLHAYAASGPVNMEVQSGAGTWTFLTVNSAGSPGFIWDSSHAFTLGSSTSNTGSGYSEKFRIDNTGNVGIGTATPGYKLDIQADSSAVDGFRITNSTNGVGAQIQNRLINNASSVAYYGLTASGYTAAPIISNRAYFGSYGVDTMIWTESSNDILFATNGASGGYSASNERMRITSAGNVGIGTTNPGATLSFSNAIAEKIRFYDGGSTSTSFGIGISSGEMSIYAGGSGAISFYDGGYGGTLIGGFNPGLGLRLNSTSNQIYQNSYAGSILINNTLSVHGSGDTGNVGIGTTNPSRTLEVNGAIGFASSTNTVLHANNGDIDFLAYDPSGHVYLRAYTGNNVYVYSGATQVASFGASALLLSASSNQIAQAAYAGSILINNTLSVHGTGDTGNVGIGTATPARLFVIGENSVGASMMAMQNSSTGYTTGDGITISVDAGTKDVGFWNYENSSIYWGTNNTSQMSISPTGVVYIAGNLGIGTTSPSKPLSIYNSADSSVSLGRAGAPSTLATWAYNSGTMTFGTTGNDDLALIRNGSNVLTITSGTTTLANNLAFSGASGGSIVVTANNDFTFGTNNTERMRISGAGLVGIGTTSPGEKLDVSGYIKALGAMATGGQLLIGGDDFIGPYIVSHTNSSNLSTINAIGSRWKSGAGGHVFESSSATTIGGSRTWTVREVIGPTGNIGLGGAISDISTLAEASMVINAGNVGTTPPFAKMVQRKYRLLQLHKRNLE